MRLFIDAFFYKVDKPEDPPGRFPGNPGDVEMI
jgi:hypothetical protein